MSCGCKSNSNKFEPNTKFSKPIQEYADEKEVLSDYRSVANFDNRTTPKTLLNYEETFTEGAVLGEGGFGQVLLVTDPQGDKFALKVLLKTDKKVLQEETGTIGALSEAPSCDKDIVCLYDVFQFDRNGKRVYGILSEYIDGYDLSKAKKMGVTMDLHQIYCISMWLIKTIQRLHHQDFTHKDIKPGNIMYNDEKKFVTLIDFGLACVRPCDNTKCPLAAKGGRATTCTPSVAGTTYYMPPELLEASKADIKDVDKMMEMYKAYDVYAIGTSIYELIDTHINNGKGHAFPRDKNEEVTSYVYQPLENVDEDLNVVLAGMLSPDPKMRYNIDEAYSEMEAYGETKGWECYLNKGK